MSMAVEYRPQPMAGGLGYDTSRYQPHFTNPWTPSSSASGHSGMYASSYAQSPPSQMEHKPQQSHQQQPPPPPMSMGYAANPAASSLGSGAQPVDMPLGCDPRLTHPTELVPSRSYGTSYNASVAPPSQPSYTSAPASRYSPERMAAANGYAYEADPSRRSSYATTSGSSRASFSDEMASARGMVAMANGQDITPRNIYNNGNPRSTSQDSYGFPATQSHNSSVSSYPYYGGSYSGSVDGGSMTDYSSASEDARVLPGTAQLINGFPPEPSAMMNQFNAKMSSSAQKKHKCKICEKRFTRPSSLQTHMYSHTGEKRCGRQFSVVSNLRRHKKVHREGNHEDATSGSPGEDE